MKKVKLNLMYKGRIGFALLAFEAAQGPTADTGPSVWVIGFQKESDELPSHGPV